MATPAHAQAVKSLNKAPGRRRFVFKAFSQRINEIDINVFRNLHKVKAEPSEGSSFLRDCLIEWRELNTAKDFILFYEETLPFVQTLPLVLLHKELIFSKLESRLQMKARLSLEPILRLIAALSRDLLEDFIPFLPRIVNALVSLLKNGGDKEPEIVEQIFTSWSYIMMYLLKYLIRDVIGVLKVTLKLRYYTKDYVEEFMAESMSFLLRNAPDEQLKKGIWKIMFEVAKKPLLTRKSGVAALLYYVMRGSSTSLHSRAERVLRILLDNSVFSASDKFDQGSSTAVEVVSSALQRLCENLEPKELNMMWKSLYQELNNSATNKRSVHLSRLLSVLISVVKVEKGCRVSDYQPTIRFVGFLVSTYIAFPGTMEGEDNTTEVVDNVLQLMLCIIDGLLSSNDMATITCCSQQWAPIFALKNSSLLTFIRELLERDHYVVKAFKINLLSAMDAFIRELLERDHYDEKAFKINILSAMDALIKSSEEIIYLLLCLCEKQQTIYHRFNILDETSGERYEGLHEFFEENLRRAVQDIVNGNILSTQIDEARLAVLWGIINCYPHFQANPALLMDFVGALRQLLSKDAEHIAGVSKLKWQSLFGAALSSYYKLHYARRIGSVETAEVLCLAEAYKSSLQVLSAVADYMDYVHGSALQDDNSSKTYHLELKAEKAIEAFGTFSKNLRHSRKDIRLTTLRILCHYEPLRSDPSIDEQKYAKKMKIEDYQASLAGNNVLQLFLSIEATPLSVSTSRKVVLSISRIQMDLSAGRICETYVPLVFNAMIGILHNRFSYLWNPASECLAILISKHTGLVWDELVGYLGQCQDIFGTWNDQESDDANLSDKHTDLVGCFNMFLNPPADSTPSTTVLSLLLQSLQKTPSVAESRSCQIIPLFLEFLGYNSKDPERVGLFNRGTCKGKEWKGVLKEWLTLLKLMQNPRSFYRSQFLKEVLQNRLLDDNDAETQMKVLECLLLWKDDFLLPYDQHLKNLISSKNLREELTTWSLSKEFSLVEVGHRAYLVPLVIRILMPKVRKLKTLASRKHTSVHHRKAVLCFIAQLDAQDLPLFFALLIKPLNIMSEDVVDLFWSSPRSSMDEFQALNFLKYFTIEAISALSWKKRYGFLHVIQHILEVFDEFHVRPFLDLLTGCVARVLVCCTANLDTAKVFESSTQNLPSYVKANAALNQIQDNTVLKQFKDLRSLCLKIIALVLDKYEDQDLGSEFWDHFFTALKPLIENFKQEGSSSEKPSSLFSCFLAMSRSHNLVRLLCREKHLVPDIYSILTVTTASEAIKCSVLKFIENLLILDSGLDGEENFVGEILASNAETLICSLHSLFQSDITKRTSVRYHGEREMGILKLLSKYMTDPLHANKYLDVLLSFLDKNVKDSDIRREALLTIQDIIPLLGIESSRKILNVISPLLVNAELDTRLCICDLLEGLAKTDSSLVSVAKLIRDLNATSAMEIDGLEYDTIANTYAKIGVDFFKTVSQEHTLIILSQGVYHMLSEELTLRHGAYGLLRSFIEFSVLMLGQEVLNVHEFPKEVAAKVDGNYWTGARVLLVTRTFLLKHIGDTLGRGGSIRKEWIDLLREMVIKLPDVANLSSLKALCSEDAEVDFFNNIVHLQKHRRARALMRFANMISKNDVSEEMLKAVFVPLIFNMLLDGQDGKDDNVRTACVEALASVSACMGWKSYYALLTRCFREMSIHVNKKKILLRLICSMLDKFHFTKGGNNQESEDSSDDPLNGNSFTEIETCLHKTVFPKIQKLMNSDSQNVNVNINLAALKVLKLLPEDIMDSQLPTIVHRISNFLKSRQESIRDEARLALAACLKELGLDYLQFVVKTLRAILKRGFELHVLGYTLNFILSRCLSKPLSGNLDYCLEELLTVVENDILGDVAEQKEVEKIASKMKETRKCKSFESLKLIAQNVTFKSHAWKLLSPVTASMQRNLTPKVEAKLESMLDHIAAGIESNPSVDQTELFIFLHGLIEDGISEENELGKHVFSSDPKKGGRNDRQQKSGSTGLSFRAKSCSHFISAFALGLLYDRMKKMKLDESNEQLLSMLDPFVKLLGNCLSSKYEDIVSSSLRCLTPLIRLPLPSLGSQADKIKTILLSIAQMTVNSSSPLVEACLKLLRVLLQSKKITLSSDQLHMLVQFPMFVDLETNPSFIALSLLKAIVKRKLVVPEIYDIAVRVAELMVTSQLESIRKKCSQILLQFLVDYDLSEKRLQQHIDFLLGNLRYEHSTGREAVLEMLHAIIIKFKKPSLDKQSQTLFIHLVVCLANDHDNKVRSMTGAVIRLLIGRISPQSVHSILEYCLSWYLGEKQQLWAAAAQVLGLLIEVMKKNFRKHVNRLLPVSKRILQSAISTASHQEQDTPNEAGIPFWREAYYSLVMVEKMLHQFPDLCFGEDLEGIWESICEMLLHPHAWLRNISCRLINYYFGATAEMRRENNQDSLTSSLLRTPSRLFKVAVSLCFQLKAQLADDAATISLLKANLVFAMSTLHSLLRSTVGVNPSNRWSTLEQDEQMIFLKAFQLLDSRKGSSMFLSLTSADGQNSEKNSIDPRNVLVSNLLKKLGKLALEMDAIQMRTVFNIFTDFALQISQEECHQYAFQLLLPLYKVCEGFVGKVIPDDIKQLAREVSGSIRDALGTQTFVQVYSEIRKTLKAKRDKRRHDEKLMAVVNPMRNAKRKLRLAEKNRAHKKRKILTMKMARWMRR